MTTAQYSFHCVICYDEFNKAERYPVVLPCGHTYVCHDCTEKLDKCMECRSSLWATASTFSSTATTSIGASYRTNPSRNVIVAATANQQQEQRRRLPTPKNVVLLSLMDHTAAAAATTTSAVVKNQNDEMQQQNDGTFEDCNEGVQSTEQQQNSIGDCGTYMVQTREGLTMVPMETFLSTTMQEPNPWDQAMQKLVEKFPNGDEETTINSTSEGHSINDDNNNNKVVRLNYGDHIQIVAFQNGWARVGRGYGYVKVDSSSSSSSSRSLVKVGFLKDRACQIEAMLHALSAKRKSMESEEKRWNECSLSLMKDLEDSLQLDQDCVFTAATTSNEAPHQDLKLVVSTEVDYDDKENSIICASTAAGVEEEKEDSSLVSTTISLVPYPRENAMNNANDLEPSKRRRRSSLRASLIIESSQGGAGSLGCFFDMITFGEYSFLPFQQSSSSTTSTAKTTTTTTTNTGTEKISSFPPREQSTSSTTACASIDARDVVVPTALKLATPIIDETCNSSIDSTSITDKNSNNNTTVGESILLSLKKDASVHSQHKQQKKPQQQLYSATTTAAVNFRTGRSAHKGLPLSYSKSYNGHTTSYHTRRLFSSNMGNFPRRAPLQRRVSSTPAA